jgi:hypothetical protein
MDLEEMKNVLDFICNTDISEMEVLDQITVLGAFNELAKTLEPIYKKYKNSVEVTFKFHL